MLYFDCESYLSHLASIEEVLHHKQVQFLLRVILGVLVTDPVNAEYLRQRCRPLWCKHGCYLLYLKTVNLREKAFLYDAYFLLHSSSDVGEVVRCKVQE